MGKWWIWVLEWLRPKASRRRLSLWFSLNKAQIRRSSNIQCKESSVTQGWVSLSLMTFTVVYKWLYSSNILPAATRPGFFANHVSFDFWANLNRCGWSIKRSGWNFRSCISFLFHCCEFLRQEIVQVLHKVIVQVFSQVAFKVFFFFQKNVFGCKNRAALATTSRRPQRNAVIPATDGNAELVMKKSPCLLNVCPFAKFPRRPFWRTYQWFFYWASKSSIIINVLLVLRQVVSLVQFITFRHNLIWKGFLLLMSWDPSASLSFPVETSTVSFSRCSGILLAGSEIGKSEGIELSMGSTVTIKDMTTLEEFIFINSLHQCQSVWFGGGGGGRGGG